MTQFSLLDLEGIITERAASGEANSWTVRLIEQGLNKAAEKLGEEAVETVVAAVARDQDGLRDEAADLLYHLLVVLHIKGVSVDEVMSELEHRTRQSGIDEKAARSSSPSSKEA